MPRWSKVINLGNGVTAIACGSSPRQKCSTPGCTRHAGKLCDYPVTRKGKPGTCDRAVCDRCATSIAPDVDYCAPHAREHQKARGT